MPGHAPSQRGRARPKAGTRTPAGSQESVRTRRVPVVGIGASAGGLEAFQALLQALPERSGLAYVLIQHQAALPFSVLPAILSRWTTMPVSDALDGQRVERDHVYVIPPFADLAVEEGAFRLVPRTRVRGAHLPVDLFFRTLAADLGPLAIGVVLSGMGSDGTEGAKAIRAAGGHTFALDPGLASYQGMPMSALRAGAVEEALPVDALARELVRLGRLTGTTGRR